MEDSYDEDFRDCMLHLKGIYEDLTDRFLECEADLADLIDKFATIRRRLPKQYFIVSRQDLHQQYVYLGDHTKDQLEEGEQVLMDLAMATLKDMPRISQFVTYLADEFRYAVPEFQNRFKQLLAQEIDRNLFRSD